MTSGLLFDSLGKSNKFGIFWIFSKDYGGGLC